MNYLDPEAERWARNMAELFRYRPKLPFQAVPYDMVRGIGWRIMDGNGTHVAIVFEEEAALMIAQRMNE